jgi:hypothetical protein
MFSPTTADTADADDTYLSFWDGLEGSEDEGQDASEITFESACLAQIPFGKKHRGEKLGELVRSKSGRSYLRYLLDWDGLFEDLKANIECVLAAYAATIGKDATSPTKKRKR